MSLMYCNLFQVRVKIEGDNEPQPTIPREEGQVPFVFVGTVESISNAKVLLEYHLAHLRVSNLLFNMLYNLSYYNQNTNVFLIFTTCYATFYFLNFVSVLQILYSMLYNLFVKLSCCNYRLNNYKLNKKKWKSSFL